MVEKSIKNETGQEISYITFLKAYKLPIYPEPKVSQDNDRYTNGALQVQQTSKQLRPGRRNNLQILPRGRETAEHFLCYCEGLGRTMNLLYVEETSSTSLFAMELSSILWRLIKNQDQVFQGCLACHNRPNQLIAAIEVTCQDRNISICFI